MATLLFRGLKRKRFWLAGFVLVLLGLLFAGPSLWVTYHIRQARQALEERDADRALGHLATVQTLDADHAEAEFLLARAKRRLGALHKVREHIQRAWDLGYPVELLQREQWLALAQAGQLRESEPHVQELMSDPRGDGPAICEAFVNGYLSAHRIDKAMSLLDAWQADFPDDEQPHFMRGFYAERIAQDAKAAEEYQTAFDLAPHRSDVQLHLAQALVKLHRYEEAAGHFRELSLRQADDPEIQTGWGECLLAEGKTEQARALFTRVLAEQPDHIRARVALGRLEMENGRPDIAVRSLQSIVEEQPYSYAVRYVFAQALRAAGETEQAQEHFAFVEKARSALSRAQHLVSQVRKEPDNLAYRFEIGKTLLTYDDPPGGAGWLRSVLDLDPHHLPTHEALAEFHAEYGPANLAEVHRKRVEELKRMKDEG